MNPFCTTCELEMRCARNGVVVECRPPGGHYYIGDRYECPGCGASVAVGFGNPSPDCPPPGSGPGKASEYYTLHQKTQPATEENTR